jgi:hypothetical protein
MRRSCSMSVTRATMAANSSRLAGLACLTWGLVVWVFGESFGAIFALGLSWLSGAPGAALLYAVPACCSRCRPGAGGRRGWAGPCCSPPGPATAGPGSCPQPHRQD